MSRAERWWRPAGQRRNNRPPIRSPRRARYASQEEYMRGFTLGMDVGEAEERRRHEERERKFREREEQLQRLADASEAASNGDPGPMDELAREMGLRDDTLDVADAAGVTPLEPPEGLSVDEWAERGVDDLAWYLKEFFWAQDYPDDGGAA